MLTALLTLCAVIGAPTKCSADPTLSVMPLFVKLIVSDVTASSEWYRSALGFRTVYASPGDDGTEKMNHLRLGKYQDLILVEDKAVPSGKSRRGKGVTIYFSIAKGTDSLARRARAAGARVSGPAVTPWNTKELTVTDPDGYILAFSEPNDQE